MAGKRYQAKDRTVAKMERTGLVEENVRTGEKTRTSDASTREITFDGRSDSGRIQRVQEHSYPEAETQRSNAFSSPRQQGSHPAGTDPRGSEKAVGYSSTDPDRQEAQGMQDAYNSSSQSNNWGTGKSKSHSKSHRSWDTGEREADASGSRRLREPDGNDPYPGKGDMGGSAHLDGQEENGLRREDYTNIRNNRAENAGSGDTSNDLDQNENSRSKERIQNRRKAAEKYREQASYTGGRPGGSGTGMENVGNSANHVNFNGNSSASFSSASAENNQYDPLKRLDSGGTLRDGNLAGTGTKSTPLDGRLSGISSEDLHRKVRKEQVRQGFQQAQAAQGQGAISSGKAIKPGTSRALRLFLCKLAD